MNIKHLTIINFRSIGHFEGSFTERGMNVFIGDNGAGKSSVIKAIKILYSWFAARIRNPKGNGMPIDIENIKSDADYCFLGITVEELGQEISWQLYRQRNTYREKSPYKTNLYKMSALASSVVERCRDGKSSWPMMSFYGVTRSISNPPLRIHKKHKLQGLDLYDKESLESGSSFNTFFYWFREKEDIENEERLSGNDGYRDSQLESVRKSIVSVFSGFSNFRVNRRHKTFEISKNDHVFRFSQLSDGEKCYLGLVMDIARSLSISSNGIVTDALSMENVVLIDELDLHLHPKWQMNVLNKLRVTFPNCQFFVTTHSPYILSDVNTKEDSLYKVVEGEVMKIETNPYGKTVGELLLSDFGQNGLRNEKVNRLLVEAWSCLKADDFDKQRFLTLIDNLREYIPHDIELVKLDIEYKRKEKDYAEK